MDLWNSDVLMSSKVSYCSSSLWCWSSLENPETECWWQQNILTRLVPKISSPGDSYAHTGKMWPTSVCLDMASTSPQTVGWSECLALFSSGCGDTCRLLVNLIWCTSAQVNKEEVLLSCVSREKKQHDITLSLWEAAESSLSSEPCWGYRKWGVQI